MPIIGIECLGLLGGITLTSKHISLVNTLQDVVKQDWQLTAFRPPHYLRLFQTHLICLVIINVFSKAGSQQ